MRYLTVGIVSRLVSGAVAPSVRPISTNIIANTEDCTILLSPKYPDPAFTGTNRCSSPDISLLLGREVMVVVVAVAAGTRLKVLGGTPQIDIKFVQIYCVYILYMGTQLPVFAPQKTQAHCSRGGLGYVQSLVFPPIALFSFSYLSSPSFWCLPPALLRYG